MHIVVVKRVSDMAGYEVRSCHAMSYGPTGDISPWLKEARETGQPADVVMLKDHGKIIGWAFRWRHNGATGYWTRHGYRGRGLGTQLVKETLKLGKISTHPHDYNSAKLFVKTKSLPRDVAKEWKDYVKEMDDWHSGKAA